MTWEPVWYNFEVLQKVNQTLYDPCCQPIDIFGGLVTEKLGVGLSATLDL